MVGVALSYSHHRFNFATNLAFEKRWNILGKERRVFGHPSPTQALSSPTSPHRQVLEENRLQPLPTPHLPGMGGGVVPGSQSRETSRITQKADPWQLSTHDCSPLKKRSKLGAQMGVPSGCPCTWDFLCPLEPPAVGPLARLEGDESPNRCLPSALSEGRRPRVGACFQKSEGEGLWGSFATIRVFRVTVFERLLQAGARCIGSWESHPRGRKENNDKLEQHKRVAPKT